METSLLFIVISEASGGMKGQEAREGPKEQRLRSHGQVRSLVGVLKTMTSVHMFLYFSKPKSLATHSGNGWGFVGGLGSLRLC